MIIFLSILLITSVISTNFIKSSVTCPIVNVDLDKIHIINIDTYPNVRLNLFKRINWSIILPKNSTVLPKYCNIHSTYVMAAALGYKKETLQFKNLPKVTYIPALNCYGSGYEPDLIKSLEETYYIAKKNSINGINTVLIYSILGIYNSQKKLDIFNSIANLPKTFIVITIGNNNQLDYCPLKILLNKNLFIIGGTENGNKLLNISNKGKCVAFYLPGKYKSQINDKLIIGTSYAAPIFGYLIIRFLIYNPNASRQQIVNHYNSLATNVTDKNTQMSIFTKNNVCMV